MCLLKCQMISSQEGLVKVLHNMTNSIQQFQSDLHHSKKPMYVANRTFPCIQEVAQTSRQSQDCFSKAFHLQKSIISLLCANYRKIFHSFLRVLHPNAPSLLPYVRLSLSSNDIVVIVVVKVLEGQYQKRYSVWKICYVFLELHIMGDLITLNINTET